MFFFPEETFERIQEERQLWALNDALLKNQDYVEPVMETSLLNRFNFECRKWLGFGFILSFFKETNAYRARKVLCSYLDKELSEEIKLIEEKYINSYFFKKKMTFHLRGNLSDSLLSLLFSFIVAINYFNYFHITTNRRTPFKKILFTIPFVRQVAYVDNDNKAHFYPIRMIATNLFNIIKNPFNFLLQFNVFLYNLLFYFIEIGSQKESSDYFQIFLKGLVSLTLALIAIPIAILSIAIDRVTNLLKLLVFNPLKFILLSLIHPCCQTPNNEVQPVTKNDSANNNRVDYDKPNRILNEMRAQSRPASSQSSPYVQEIPSSPVQLQPLQAQSEPSVLNLDNEFSIPNQVLQ